MFSAQPGARDFPGWPETKTRLAQKPGIIIHSLEFITNKT